MSCRVGRGLLKVVVEADKVWEVEEMLVMDKWSMHSQLYQFKHQDLVVQSE